MESTATSPPDYGPKYLSWRADPTPGDQVGESARTIITYGNHDWCIAAVAGRYEPVVTPNPDPELPDVLTWVEVPESDALVHTALAAKADVQAIPANLDNTIASNQVRNTVRSFLESIGLPGNWVQTGTPWREIVRTICGMMIFGQRYDGSGLDSVSFGTRITGNLAIQWQAVPVGVQQAAVGAGMSLGYDMTWITPTMIVRNVLKTIAGLWGEQQVRFGLSAYNGGESFTV
jgi:hypothetical protein